jgi:hypothetical protein
MLSTLIEMIPIDMLSCYTALHFKACDTLKRPKIFERGLLIINKDHDLLAITAHVLKKVISVHMAKLETWTQ